MDIKKKLGDMPHSLEAEQALLGCLLLDPRIQFEIVATISEDDFYAESHKYIFSAMAELVSRNQTVDFVTLTDILEKNGTLANAGGAEYIQELTSVMPSSANYQRYFDIVSRDSTLRKLIRGSADIIDQCMESTSKSDALDYAEKTIFDISKASDTSELTKISSIVPTVMSKLDALTKDKSLAKGIRTKYRGLDNILNGLHGSDLIVLAARPGAGKTSLAMNIVENVALQGYSCAVFSLEMSKEQLTQRMMCSVAEVNMSNAMKGNMTQTEWLKIAKAKELLSTAKIYIDDKALIKPQEVLSRCRRLKAKGGLDLVVIDYIQLMNSATSRQNENRQQEISDITRNLKIMAKELNVPVIALSQLSRAVETNKRRPQLSDLRESGAIEQDADIVIFIHSPEKTATKKELEEGKVQQNVMEIMIEKHRNGPTGLVKLYFKQECTKFLNYNEETGEPEEQRETKNNVAVDGYENLPSKEEKPKTTADEEIF